MTRNSPLISTAAALLRAGRLVAFPTETVYGLGADAANPAAVRRIFEVKGRPPTNPLIVHVADDRVARQFAVWDTRAGELARKFWPGPLTLVLPRHRSIAAEVSAGLHTVAVRAPDHPVAQELLRAFDGPVAAPSANRSTRVSPTTALHVRAELGDAVDLILDGGPCTVGIESTVLDLSEGTQPTILRPGAVTQAEIESVVGQVSVFAGMVEPNVAAHSPGQHAVHYAPRTPTFRFNPSEHEAYRAKASDEPIGLIVLGSGESPRHTGPVVTMPSLPETYARHLYAVLRELDEMGLRAIYIELPPDEPRWLAVRDRLDRASQPV
ncbi:MAG: L-threonylcarbamoyladenylate synthase [Tepidisphaeraceae bacterium]